uniref:Transposase n=1 Tax=Knipowitschia caucasica TaxID=637954 RepID=A0AAV2LD47_KNICA
METTEEWTYNHRDAIEHIFQDARNKLQHAATRRAIRHNVKWSNTLLNGFKCLYSRNLLHWNIILLKGLKYLGSLDLLLWCQKLPLL